MPGAQAAARVARAELPPGENFAPCRAKVFCSFFLFEKALTYFFVRERERERERERGGERERVRVCVCVCVYIYKKSKADNRYIPL